MTNIVFLGPASAGGSRFSRHCWKKCVHLSIFVIFLSIQAGLARAELATNAPYAILMDYETGSVLLQENADSPVPPASMSKLMTTFMVFERLKEGSLSLDDTFSVSVNAWRKGGAASGSSTMFLEPNTRVRVEDLLRGIIIQSGNDACIVVAENLAASEADFADLMTRRARDLGLKNSVFKNATGWPDEGHEMSVADLARLAGIIIERFPEYYGLYSEKSFTYNGISQGNRNPLLYAFPGGDGMKTGHTSASGYGLVGSAERDGRRLIVVINGLKSAGAREEEAERLLDWGFREFDTHDFFAAGETVTEANVWLGQAATVPLVVDEAITLTLQRRDRRNLKVTAVFEGPVEAPIAEGQEIGELRFTADGKVLHSVPMHAGMAVPELGMVGRLTAAIRHILLGHAGS